ncbi:hypothetical protein LEP1GSC185_3978 [Leptospira licerasiae serovar Varillal str. VAR 010]|nr:hypothetical protein LEP1GSC185_3978 [Leptospira licerasiae serovar Varillal str. VAR 010]
MNDLSNQSCFEDKYLISYLTKEKRIPLLLYKHLNHCQKCQTVVSEFSDTNRISIEVFGKEITKVKSLWFGPEIHNEGWIEIPEDKKSNIYRFFQWPLTYKKRFLLIGYFAIVYNLILLFYKSFY